MLPSARMTRLPYAPTPHSFTPNTNLGATIDLDTETELAQTTAERDLYDSLSEIYGIIITLDGLEKAYIRDSVAESEYTELCTRLLKQYKSNLQDEGVAKAFQNLEAFKRDWEIECPRATERLRMDLPSTVAYPAPQSRSSTSGHHPGQYTTSSMLQGTAASGTVILTATENFITFLDALKLNMMSKDALHPLLAELIQSVNAVTDQDFDGRAKIISWLIRLNGMRAQEELGEGEARELGFDMEGAYRGFKSTLS